MLKLPTLLNMQTVGFQFTHTHTTPQDFTLDEKGFRELPQVSESSCPLQFLDVAFICCRVSYCANIDGPTTI